MDPLHTILTVVIAVLLIWLVIKIFATPIKWALKLLLNALLGFVCCLYSISSADLSGCPSVSAG